jgi:hypothetical protein
MGINAGPAPVEGIAPSGATASGSVVPSNTGGFGISPGTAPVDYNPASFMDRAGTAISDYGSSIADKATSLPENLSRFTEGAGKLMTGDPAAIDAFKASGATMTNTALPAFMGYTGMAAIDEAKAQKAESDKAAAEAATLQAAETDRIEKSKQRGLAAMRANPYMFAAGGSIDDEAGFDDWNNAPGYSGEDGSYVNEEYLARRALEVPPESPERRTRFSFTPSGAVVNSDMKAIMGRLGADYPVGKTGAVSAGVSGIAGRMPEGMRARAGAADVGIAGRVGPGMARAQMIRDLASNQNKYQLGYDIPFSKGGDTARFLSGGGDGMSDSIKATINGEQPARLADGEFVIPADVVSHLGNGSSKAGAKQLYSMMDKVRSARTGTKQQGKQINPAKYMPA